MQIFEKTIKIINWDINLNSNSITNKPSRIKMPLYERKPLPQTEQEWKEQYKSDIENDLLLWIQGLAGVEVSKSFFQGNREYEKFSQEIKHIAENASIEDKNFTIMCLDEYQKWNGKKWVLQPFSPILMGIWGDRKSELEFNEFVDKIINELPFKCPTDRNEIFRNVKLIMGLVKKHGNHIKDSITEKWNTSLTVNDNNLLETIYYYQHFLAYYEQLKYLFGLLLSLLDILDNNCDRNLLTYFNEQHYPNKGMYKSQGKNCRKIWDPNKNKLTFEKKKDKNRKKMLVEHLNHRIYQTIKVVLERIMDNKDIRNLVAHRILSVDIRTLDKDKTAKIQFDLFSFLGYVPFLMQNLEQI
jgi:hypothetical protein